VQGEIFKEEKGVGETRATRADRTQEGRRNSARGERGPCEARGNLSDDGAVEGKPRYKNTSHDRRKGQRNTTPWTGEL